MNDEYVRIIVLSNPNEPAEVFSARLSQFWTHMLRQHQATFEKVYAETIDFDADGDRLSRQYLCEEDAVDLVAGALDASGIEHAPVDWDDRWTKYEAVPSEWMQIEH